MQWEAMPGPAIIYASSRKRCEEVARFVESECRREVVVYHAGLTREERHESQDRFMSGGAEVVVATNAFGMGVDKSDIRSVIHYNLPGTLEAYYQEAGRAGRDGDDSRCVLLYAPGDRFLQEVFIENVGLPTLACIRPAVQALQDLGMHRKVQLIVSGGIRNGADAAKALALGADAVAIGTAALAALGDNDPALNAEYAKIGTEAGCYDDWHEGKDPAGITTQDPELSKRLDPVRAGRRLANYLKVMTLEIQTVARADGHNNIHNLEPEDLCSLTMEAAAMARVPLAGTTWIPGANASGGF